MNVIFFAIAFVSFLAAAWHQLTWLPAEGRTAPMEALSKAMVESATGSVELALGLIGVMSLFLGLMKVAEAGGLLSLLARLIRPLMVRLFPDVPAEHPATVRLVVGHRYDLMNNSQFIRLQRWLAVLPKETVEESPLLVRGCRVTGIPTVPTANVKWPRQLRNSSIPDLSLSAFGNSKLSNGMCKFSVISVELSLSNR